MAVQSERQQPRLSDARWHGKLNCPSAGAGRFASKPTPTREDSQPLVGEPPEIGSGRLGGLNGETHYDVLEVPVGTWRKRPSRSLNAPNIRVAHGHLRGWNAIHSY
jgi:hypothetical protein